MKGSPNQAAASSTEASSDDRVYRCERLAKVYRVLDKGATGQLGGQELKLVGGALNTQQGAPEWSEDQSELLRIKIKGGREGGVSTEEFEAYYSQEMPAVRLCITSLRAHDPTEMQPLNLHVRSTDKSVPFRSEASSTRR